MRSCIYEGRVLHRRFSPARHGFTFPLFMMCLDLSELATVFEGRPLWSVRRPALARFHRSDHLGDPARDLGDCVRDVVEHHLGRRPSGPVCLLTHLRYFGYVFNPVSIYFCHEAGAAGLDAVLLEVNNTPWGERHLYVLDARAARDRGEPGTFTFEKRFHVSPFMPMGMTYRITSSAPGGRLNLAMENWKDGAKVFDAVLAMRRTEITGASLARVLLRHPFMTARVIAAIHWQALRLWLKGVPVHTHPGSTALAAAASPPNSTSTGAPQP